MLNPRFIALLASAVLSFHALADTELQELEADEHSYVESDQQPLRALSALQSLRNITQKPDDQAPYVHELANRYKVRSLFVESQDLPIIDIQLTFNAGSARDESIEKGLYGLANMTAKLLDEGTELYSAQDIANTFERLGAQFSVQAYRDMFIVRLRVLSDPKKFEPALAIMMDVLKHATFNQSGIHLILNNTQAGQKQVQENPTRMMEVRFYHSLYGNHPYAEPVTGTQRSISKITSKQLKAFRDTYLVAQNMNIAITGKLTPREALKLSERIAGNLPQGQKAPVLPAPQMQKGLHIQHLPFHSSQAYVTMGHLGITRYDPDRPALEVANQMLGGSGFNSLLMQELRVKRGYTYGVYSNMNANQAGGTFSISYSTRQDQLLDSIRVAHQVLIDFVQQPLDQKQLEETKAGLLRAFPMNFSSNAAINAQLGAIGFYKLPADYLNQYIKKLSRLNVQEVQTALQRHLHPEQLTLVVVSEELDKTALLDTLQSNLHIQPMTLAQPASVPANLHPQQTAPDNDVPEPVQTDRHAAI